MNSVAGINTKQWVISMSEWDKDEHLYSLFGRIEGHKLDEYLQKWLGSFTIVHRQSILAKAGWYLKLKHLKLDTWAESVKSCKCGDILSMFTLSALISKHTMGHLWNGNIWMRMTPQEHAHTLSGTTIEESGELGNLSGSTMNIGTSNDETIEVTVGSIKADPATIEMLVSELDPHLTCQKCQKPNLNKKLHQPLQVVHHHLPYQENLDIHMYLRLVLH